MLRCLLLLALSLPQLAAAYPAAPRLTTNFPPGAGIQRTMRLLATSTPEHPNHVYILFYGQSITRQAWWLDVARDLEARYPSAVLRIENRAVGGFASDSLIKSAQYDLYPADPDLVIFQDYGPEPRYERIIEQIRSRTRAEIALQTDHVTEWKTPQTAKLYRWMEHHNNVWLPKIARKYGCGLIDVRAGWKEYLIQDKLQPKDLLMDEVHLNPQGNHLMSGLVEQYLQYNPALPSPYDPISVVKISKPGRNLDVLFTGSRVDVVATAASSVPISFLVDGRCPSAIPNLPVISRPNDLPDKEWPWQVGTVIEVEHKKPWIPELWTIKIDSIDPQHRTARFEISGSVTGPDGSGSTDHPFTSKSGRVVIEPQDWWTRDVKNHFTLTSGELIQWRVLPMSADHWTPTHAGESITVAEGLPNRRHVLHLHTDGLTLPIQAIVIERPAYIAPSLSWLYWLMAVLGAAAISFYLLRRTPAKRGGNSRS